MKISNEWLGSRGRRRPGGAGSVWTAAAFVCIAAAGCAATEDSRPDFGNAPGAGGADDGVIGAGNAGAVGTGWPEPESGGSAAQGTGGSGDGSCDPAFCPDSFGTPCCLPGGACGVDFGMGCVQQSTDAGAGTGGASGTGGAPGTSGAGGTDGDVGTGGSAGGTSDPPPPPTTGGAEPRVPSATGPCPPLASGMARVNGQDVRLWVGMRREDRKGAVFFYWHGTGSSPNEAVGGLGSALDEIVGEGGIVASFASSTRQGTNTGNGVWYTGDFVTADQILACAVEQLNIDTRRVYTGGCSAGGLQAGAMVYERSSYLAGAMPNSGGVIRVPRIEDPSNVPSVITTHGAAGRDVVVVDFSVTSARLVNDVVSKGGFAVNCDHGGGHCRSPTAVRVAQWEFLKAHPFGVDPSPYASGLPGNFPSVCEIVR